MSKTVRIEGRSSLGGIVWFTGWLFTIGFLNLGFWKGLLALIVWPYFLGVHFSGGPPPPVEAQIEETGMPGGARMPLNLRHEFPLRRGTPPDTRSPHRAGSRVPRDVSG